jgi:hypothetical protein
MQRCRLSAEKIFAVPKQAEAGVKMAQLARGAYACDAFNQASAPCASSDASHRVRVRQALANCRRRAPCRSSVPTSKVRA